MFIKFITMEWIPLLIPKDAISEVYKTEFGCNVTLKDSTLSILKTKSSFESIEMILTK